MNKTINKFNHKCDFCGKEMYVKPSRLKRSKRVCCSKECSNSFRKIWFKGENNHQFGLKGKLNSSYNNETVKIKGGYRHIRVTNHPFADRDGWIREHRYVAEKNLLNEFNFVLIDGVKYLSPEYEVHHIDRDKLNNSVSNLQVLTKSEHRHIHNIEDLKLEKCKLTGRFLPK